MTSCSAFCRVRRWWWCVGGGRRRDRQPSRCSTWARTAVRSSGPWTRRAVRNARRRWARSRHSTVGCRCAPRPGAVPGGSGTTDLAGPSPTTTTRNRSDLAARARQPRHIRTGRRRVWMSGVGQPTSAESTRKPQESSAPVCSGMRWRPGLAVGVSGAVSGLMSIRQPVSLAASLAFCPSLPIASDSW
jgi:hypothetical protein